MMALEELENSTLRSGRALPAYLNVLVVGVSVFTFLFAIQLLGGAFGAIGKTYAQNIIDATSNPFIGLFIGLLTTAIFQSSSTTTSMTVAAVAVGSLSLQAAIPIVMGANLGTTITSTLVSLSYITKKSAFRKAIAAGTVHDFFNILVIILLFPLELKYGFLSNASIWIASLIKIETTTPIAQQLFVYDFFDIAQFKLIDIFGPYIVLIISVFLIFGIVKVISNLLYNRMIGKSRNQFKNLVFNNKYKAFGWGLLLTSAVQSSSLTTSLIVPLVATGKIHLKRAFQFVLGANLGTTITAIIAAMFKSDAAISLAIAHFLFNFIGICIFLLVPFLTNLPTVLAERLGKLSLRYRLTGFAYILLVFFLLPFTLIYATRAEEVEEPKKPTLEISEKTVPSKR